MAVEFPRTSRNRRFLRNRKERPGPHRVLVGAATPLKLDDKTEARRLRILRQGWQEDALSYVDALPELNFAYRFQTNAAKRMRWFPAIIDPDDPEGPPIPLKDAPDVPDLVKEQAFAAMDALGTNGRTAVRPVQESLRYNLGTAGECFIVGTEDDSGKQDWKIRSIDEFMVYEDSYKLREVPLDPQGVLGWIDIDPTKTYAARLWVPHPRFARLANSPMRALLDVSEELLLLSRDVRATARSRLAGAGILKIPDGLRMLSFNEDNSGDPESEEWFGRFAESMMTPIADEGVASAVVPIAVSGEIESLGGLEHMLIERPYSALAIELRAEAIGRLATGLDAPREVLEGMSDPNHWGAWLVSDDTFRHHLEPQCITDVDCFTIGYMRPWLQAAGCDPYYVDRICIWYDPTELITKPDPAENAILAHDRLVISNKRLALALGFTEEDLPSPLEMEIRMITKLRSFPPNVLEALLHALDPNLEIPPIEQSGQVPGMGPKGAIPAVPPGIAAPGGEGGPPAAPGTPGAPPVPTGGGSPAGPGAPAAASPPPAPMGTPALPPGSMTGETVSLASEAPKGPTPDQLRLSRKLAEIDRDVRTRLQQAACESVMRLLDRAGAKLRNKVGDRRMAKALGASAEGLRESVKAVSNRRMASTLGKPLVAALGFNDAHALLDPGWEDLQAQFMAWVSQAQAAAVATAAQLGGVSPDGPEARAAAGRMSLALPGAWSAFRDELDKIASALLYNPDPNADAELNVNPNTVVPTGVVRRALAIAGGTKPKGIVASDLPGGSVDVADRYPSGTADDLSNVEGVISGEGHVLQDVPSGQPTSGQIGTGDAVGDLLGAANMSPTSYVWSHGPSLRPFEPHEDLDGTEFSSFSDDSLANPDTFPDNDFYFPGDHDGCSCDFMTIWGDASGADGGDGDDTDTGDDTDGGSGDDSGVAGATADLSDDTGPVLVEEGAQGEGEAIPLNFSDWSDATSWGDSHGISVDYDALVQGNGWTVDDFTTVAQTIDDMDKVYPGLADSIDSITYGGQSMGEAANVTYSASGHKAVADSIELQLQKKGDTIASMALKDPEKSVVADLQGAISHEMGHVLQDSTPYMRQIAGQGMNMTDLKTSLIKQAMQRAGYANARGSLLTDVIRGDVSNYAATNELEFHAETVALFRDSHALAQLDPEALQRLGAFRDAVNEIAGRDVLVGQLPGEAAAAADETAALSGMQLSDWARAVADISSDPGPQSLKAAADDLDAARASVMQDVAQAKANAQSVLERMGVPEGIARPAAMASGQNVEGAEYDWYYQLSSQERDRLRNNGWVTDATGVRPDQAALASHDSVDQAMGEFLDATRTIDAANLVQGGRALSANIYDRFGGFNFDNLAPSSPYKVTALFGQKADAIDYVASARTSQAAEEVERTLTGKFGQPIYNMSYDDYEAEVLSLYDQVADVAPISDDDEWGTVYDAATQEKLNRLDELMPVELAPLDQEPDLANIWAQAQQIAVIAGLKG